jgi:hypothetical protein
MPKSTITQTMVYQAHLDVCRKLHELGQPIPTLHLGNSSHKIHNILISERRNMWPDGMAGTTKREAYNALRIMSATLAATIEHQQDMREARARTGL